MNWESSIKALKKFAKSLPEGQEKWQQADAFLNALERVESSLDQDLQALNRDASFIFSTDDKMHGETKRCIQMFRDWVISGRAPSLTALCIFALENFNVHDDEYVRLVLLASILGEVENNLPYHSNMHYRKVVVQLIRLIANHNEIYDGTSKNFDDRQICVLLTAACIHDYGHDGRGNTVEGVHERARLELRSYELFEHFMMPLGFDDDDTLTKLQVMLICTDVTPIGDPRSPVDQMKAAYRYHFLGEKERVETLNLSGDLKVLEKDLALTMMALILHEADIATSAGLDYSVTKYETSLLQRELVKEEARPEDVKIFLEKICRRQMLSDAAQRLYAANMARIYALAEQDYKAGNEAYPPLMRSDFILGQSLSDFSGSSTSVN